MSERSDANARRRKRPRKFERSRAAKKPATRILRCSRWFRRRPLSPARLRALLGRLELVTASGRIRRLLPAVSVRVHSTRWDGQPVSKLSRSKRRPKKWVLFRIRPLARFDPPRGIRGSKSSRRRGGRSKDVNPIRVTKRSRRTSTQQAVLPRGRNLSEHRA